MNSFKNENTKNINQNILNINHNSKFNLTNFGQFNTFKFKHFNNFFNNLFHEKLKSELINYLSEKNNKSTPVFKNEFLNETLSDKTISDFNEKSKIIRIKKHNAMVNTKFKNIDSYFSYNTNGSTRYKSLDKIYLNKFNQSISNNKSSSINSKFLSKEQNTIPNISNLRTNNSNSKIKLQLDISSLNNNLFKKRKNKFSNTSETYFNKNYKINKDQQLPKDAANCLLLFLKKNKKNLQKTSKYYLIYQKYKSIIDNIIDNIPNEESYKKNNHENILGYYKRIPMEGNETFDPACLIWNNYNSKSEKRRHVHILSELTKLKGYMEKYKKDKFYYIKDFLNKFNINYNEERLLIFEKFMESFDIKTYEKFLEPGLGIKDMFFKIFEEGEKFEKEKKEKNNSIPALNLKCSIQNKKNNGMQPYSLYNKKNNDSNNINILQKNLNLSDTNSYLKEMERQKLADKPHKTYSSNYNLMVNDLGKEIDQVETEIITEKQYKNLQPLLFKKNNSKYLIGTDNEKEIFVTSNKYKKGKADKNEQKYFSPNMRREKIDKYKIYNTEMINKKINIKNNYDKVELKDVRRKLKLTEYIIYNKAKNKLKLKELGKGELYEYTKKEDNIKDN